MTDGEDIIRICCCAVPKSIPQRRPTVGRYWNKYQINWVTLTTKKSQDQPHWLPIPMCQSATAIRVMRWVWCQTEGGRAVGGSRASRMTICLNSFWLETVMSASTKSCNPLKTDQQNPPSVLAAVSILDCQVFVVLEVDLIRLVEFILMKSGSEVFEW